MNVSVQDMTNIPTTPTRVFVVPYRDRIHQKFFFSQHMSFVLEDDKNYEILFVHQCDTRHFNRGAMKNIGFIAIKEKYPETYQNITLVFHDIDTLPFHKLFDYITTPGVVKHYYGFTNALGGIVVINANDFENINGFPNYWGWGLEDTLLQKRCIAGGLHIDRSTFYELGSPEILHLFDGMKRIVSREEPAKMLKETMEGLLTLNNVQYTYDNESLNPNDNQYIWTNPNIYYINVTTFNTMVHFDQNKYHIYDLREPSSAILSPDNKEYTTRTTISPNEWTNNMLSTSVSQPEIPPISYYTHPTSTKPKIGLGGLSLSRK